MSDLSTRAAIAGEVVAETMATLPHPIAEVAGNLPVFVEDRPSREDIDSGVGADWLGIFEGSPCNETGHLMPPRIRIWAENIWLDCSGFEARFREEVRVTLLHEVGHYLGLDEEGVRKLGLE